MICKLDQILGSPNRLIGPCVKNIHVCTDHARFHLQIATTLQRTPMTSDRELELLLGRGGSGSCTERENKTVQVQKRLPNPVFFFEITQLSDTNETRNELFRDDFSYLFGVDGKFSTRTQN